MARVKAETLSDSVPEDMIVDINFRVDDEAWLAVYAAASSSSKVLAYVFRFAIVVESFLVSSDDGDGKLASVPMECQSGRASNIWISLVYRFGDRPDFSEMLTDQLSLFALRGLLLSERGQCSLFP